MPFEKVERELSLGSLMFQLFLAYCGPVVLLAVMETWLNIQDTPRGQIFGYGFIAAAGAVLAFCVSSISHYSTREGRLVWMLPALLESVVVVSELYSEKSISALSGILYVNGPGQGEDAWILVLLTLPAWGCCCYSATMWWQRR